MSSGVFIYPWLPAQMTACDLHVGLCSRTVFRGGHFASFARSEMQMLLAISVRPRSRNDLIECFYADCADGGPDDPYNVLAHITYYLRIKLAPLRCLVLAGPTYADWRRLFLRPPSDARGVSGAQS